MMTIASSSEHGPDYEPPQDKMKALVPGPNGRLIEPEPDVKSQAEVKP